MDFSKYMKSIGFTEARIEKLRTIDRQLLKHLGRVECTPTSLDARLKSLPAPKGEEEFRLIAINLSGEFGEFIPNGWRLAGHDLSDETLTSSLLNCGPWTGRLAPLYERLNTAGLLSLDDASSAQALLPLEWGQQEHHARVVIWALYESST